MTEMELGLVAYGILPAALGVAFGYLVGLLDKSNGLARREALHNAEMKQMEQMFEEQQLLLAEAADLVPPSAINFLTAPYVRRAMDRREWL